MKKRIGISIIVFCSIVLISGIVFAKYYEKIKFIYSMSMAKPILTLVGDITSENKEMNKENGVEYTLVVSNFDSKQVSDVAQSYYLKIFSNELDMSEFDINITKEGNNVECVNGLTESFTFNANSKETDEYVIHIAYANENSINKLRKY